MATEEPIKFEPLADEKALEEWAARQREWEEYLELIRRRMSNAMRIPPHVWVQSRMNLGRNQAKFGS